MILLCGSEVSHPSICLGDKAKARHKHITASSSLDETSPITTKSYCFNFNNSVTRLHKTGGLFWLFFGLFCFYVH